MLHEARHPRLLHRHLLRQHQVPSPEAVCYDGECILICEDSGDSYLGGTSCNLVEPPWDICRP